MTALEAEQASRTPHSSEAVAAAHCLEAVQPLWPGRMLALRLFDLTGTQGTWVYATAALRPPGEGAPTRVLAGSKSGFTVALGTDGGLGTLHVEYAAPTPIPAEDEVAANFLATHLTAKLQNARQLDRLGAQLADMRELQDQVIQAEKLATVGQLAAGVVHELNNPLTSISVYAEYLLKKHQERQADPRDIERLQRIVASADRILHLSRDLVTYARPSTDQPSHIPAETLLDQALVFCEHLVNASGVHVDKCYAPDLSPIYGVKAQLLQVFINLITNACHAMEPTGGGTLSISTHAAPDGRVRVRVRDAGTGIAPEHLAQVFEPFFTTKTEGHGTGLGLSIVRNILDQQRGSIRVESQFGAGTLFDVELITDHDLRAR